MNIRHNERDNRFETEVEGETAYVEYEMEDGNAVFTHTIVPAALEGRGIASKLVRAGLDYAREKKLAVVPQCAYVQSWLEKNPDYSDLVRD